MRTSSRTCTATWTQLPPHCHMPCSAGPDSLVFVSDQAQLATARERGAAILIVQRDIVDQLAATEPAFGCCFSVKNVSMGMAVLLKHFDRKRERFTQWGERHPTAIVHESATIGADVLLGPYCVIGANAVIGDGCCIGSHVVVENDVRLGANTLLHPHVFVGAGCELGRDCEVHPHTSIGSDGFGYAVGASRRPQKLSHLGNVCIGDEVEIGSNCAIDRATLSSTYIRSGTKLDNICHIAHNCDLGEDGFYTAGFMMAGSTTIGRRFMTGGNSVVSAHLKLADDVVLAGRSTVTSDVPVARTLRRLPAAAAEGLHADARRAGAAHRNPQEPQPGAEAPAVAGTAVTRPWRRHPGN